jgi:sugar transferase EpsL
MIMKSRARCKRAFDFVFAVFILIVLFPLFAIIALLAYVINGWPILFKQERPGLMGKRFTLYKFRTMKDVYDGRQNLSPDKDRLMPFGILLRRTSLDELPELFNVLKGDMSFVGPRPLLTRYLHLYTPSQRRRHEVKPGITGWAQINGRNAITWKEKFALDIWYVDHQSFLLDLKIIVLTIWKMLKKEGINQSGQVTMEEFKG